MTDLSPTETAAPLKKNEDNLELCSINVAPLSGVTLNTYARLSEEVNRVASVVTQTKGGCLLVTGYRGVGKTSFINKVLFDAKATLEKENTQLVVVQLNLARGYSTDKLLRRLIRELYHVINNAGLFGQLPPILQRKLDIAFMRTSHHMKAAMMQGLKEVVSKTSSETFSTSNTYEFAPDFGVDKLSLSLGSMAHQRSRSKTREIMNSTEKARERGLEVEFLEYDDEIAENDLCGLITDLQGVRASNETQNKQLKKPEWFWRIFADEFQIGTSLIKNYRLVKSDQPSSVRGVKIVFVLDEIDKMTVEQAEEIFRSLKNLFLQGDATFMMVTGKDFYYHWLLTRNTEDDILFSLFTGIFHIPLFSDEEFSEFAQALVKTEKQVFPSDLLAHLKFKSKGTPREFLRELMRFAEWRDGKQVLRTPHGNAIALSATLYCALQEVYAPYEQDDRIDIGLKDHVRRSLHHWLDKMILQVYFTKESLLWDRNKDRKNNDEEILITRSGSDLDNLIALLIQRHIVEEVELSGKKFYTFVKALRDQMHEVIPTVGSELRLEQEKLLTHALDFVRDAQEKVSAGNFAQAKSLLDSLPSYQGAENETSPVYEQVKTMQDTLEKSLKKQTILAEAEDLYKSGALDRAIDSLEKARSEFGYEPAMTDKIEAWKLERDLAQIDRLLDMGRVEAAGELAENSLLVFSVTPATKDLLAQVDQRNQKVNQIMRLLVNIEQALHQGSVERARSDLKKLEMLVGPSSVIYTNAQGNIQKAEEILEFLDKAQVAMRTGDWAAARDQLNRIDVSTFEFAQKKYQTCMIELEEVDRIESQLKFMVRTNNMLELGKALEFIADTKRRYPLIAEGLLLSEAERLVIKKMDALKTLDQIRSSLKSGELESAWDYWDRYGNLIENPKEDVDYKSLRRELENTTIAMAKRHVEDLYQKYSGQWENVARSPKDHPIEILLDDVMVILDPLLQRDPDNKRAKEVIAFAKKTLGIKDL